MSRGQVIGAWTFVVVAAWVMLAAVGGEDCSDGDFICFDAGDLLVILALPALGLWLVGVVVMWIVIWIKSRWPDAESGPR